MPNKPVLKVLQRKQRDAKSSAQRNLMIIQLSNVVPEAQRTSLRHFNRKHVLAVAELKAVNDMKSIS